MLPGTVKNFELPNFDDKTGVKEWDLFGDSAEYINDRRVNVKTLRLELLEEGENPKIKAVVRSPEAQVNPTTSIVEGDSDLFVDADAFSLRGKKWRWNGVKKFVEVFSNVDIDFKGDHKPDSTQGSPETKISSNYASLDHSAKNNLFILKGDCRIENADTKISCDTVKLDAGRSAGKGADRLNSVIAEGGVKMLHLKKDVRAGQAVVIPHMGAATLFGKPQIVDIPSRAKLSGHAITLSRDEKSVVAESGKNGVERARAEFLHFTKGEKDQKIIVEANNIEMRGADKESEFVFKGSVKVSADDFTADCDTLTAYVSNIGDPSSSTESANDGKADVRLIKGVGSVRLSNASGVARAKEMEIIPAKSEIMLSGDARLDDPTRGTKLFAPVIIFLREQNRGLALSDSKDGNSFVELRIVGASDGLAEGAGRAAAKKSESVVKSRRLNFERKDEKLYFAFSRDVSIKSDNADAVCENMEVIALADKNGGAEIQRITARNGVKVAQSNYSADAEIANIYPKLEVSDKKTSKSRRHRFVELLTAPDNPALRPTVKLPAFGNLGLNDPSYAKKSESAPTYVKSDKQWLTSAADADRYFFEGDVIVTGTDMNASCDKIEVVMKAPQKGAPKEIVQIVMRDNVKLTQGFKDATCGRADIFVKEEMVVLAKNPVVVNREDNSRASGPRMVYNRGNKGVSIESDFDTGSGDDFTPPQRPTLVLPLK